jgi:hypothetical protein
MLQRLAEEKFVPKGKIHEGFIFFFEAGRLSFS